MPQPNLARRLRHDAAKWVYFAPLAPDEPPPVPPITQQQQNAVAVFCFKAIGMIDAYLDGAPGHGTGHAHEILKGRK